jgi:hypothetical protein
MRKILHLWLSSSSGWIWLLPAYIKKVAIPFKASGCILPSPKYNTPVYDEKYICYAYLRQHREATHPFLFEIQLSIPFWLYTLKQKKHYFNTLLLNIYHSHPNWAIHRYLLTDHFLSRWNSICFVWSWNLPFWKQITGYKLMKRKIKKQQKHLDWYFNII